MTEADRLLAVYRDRVHGYVGVDPGFGDLWRRWCRTALSHGGELVVPPGGPEPDLDLLLAEATPQPAPVRVLDGGRDCHANVAQLWLDGEAAAIGTGYALGEGLWRQHSWAIDADGGLIETKLPAEAYLGITLPAGERTVLFVLNNYAGDVPTMLRSGSERANEILELFRARRARQLADGS